ncbi:hypothetical protein IWZ00DRAFT_307491 [Phyllosticta capitalensis]
MQTQDIREFLTGSQDFNVLTASREISSLSFQHDTPCFSLARCQTGSALKKRGKKQEESNQLLVLRQSSRCRSSPSPFGTALTGARTCLRPTTPTTKKIAKRTTAGIRCWSPTQLLIGRKVAYLWKSGRGSEFSTCYGRT